MNWKGIEKNALVDSNSNTIYLTAICARFYRTFSLSVTEQCVVSKPSLIIIEVWRPSCDEKSIESYCRPVDDPKLV